MLTGWSRDTWRCGGSGGLASASIEANAAPLPFGAKAALLLLEWLPLLFWDYLLPATSQSPIKQP